MNRSRIVPACLCLVVLLALFLAGCKGPVLTPSSLYGRCLSYTPSGRPDSSCGSQPQICATYNEILSAQYTSRQACVQACTDYYYHSPGSSMVGACSESARYAWSDCTTYCRYTYE